MFQIWNKVHSVRDNRGEQRQMSIEQFAVLATLLGLLQAAIGLFINHRLGKNLEQFKGQIQQTVSEHDTRYAYLHKRRGEAIDQLYKQIIKMRRRLNQSLVVSLDDVVSLKAQRTESHTDFEELYNSYLSNRIYLDEELCKKIDALNRNLGNALEHTEIDYTYPDMIRAYRDRTKAIIANEIDPLLGQIENQIRDILGLNSQARTNN
jgi:hypothetical protein